MFSLYQSGGGDATFMLGGFGHALRQRSKAVLSLSLVASAAFLIFQPPVLQAQDPSIEKLLKKLPPPEKLVKVPQEVRDQNEVLGDPLTIKLGQATADRNWRHAVGLAKDLIAKHPNNLWARCILGAIQSTLAHFAEAHAAFAESTKINPKFGYGYMEMGAVEVMQQHFAAAIPYFKTYSELEPKSGLGWVFLSGCTEKLGRRQESLDYAKRAIAVEPETAGTWLQLAHAENALGHTDNAKRALARAHQIDPGLRLK
jgi:predicted Zn-dependent protease